MNRRLSAVLCALLAAPAAMAWDADGHRAITTVAIEGLSAQGPAWLKDKAVAKRVADQSTVPDRWRGVKVSQLAHANNPDHYFDVEDLEAYDLDLRRIAPLRLEFVKQLLEIRAAKGWKLPPKPINPARDPDKTQEWPGFLPFAIAEQYGKVQSAFKVIRVLEAMNEPARAHQLEQAKADATVHLGILAHYVGDAAQPLHTTKHHHGWVGDNPKGYTTDRGFHSYIDGGILRHHRITAETVRPSCRFTRAVDAKDPWNDVLAHLERSHAEVEPFYEFKRTGDLEKEPGKKAVEARLADGATMLAALVEAAWKAAEPDKKDIADFKKFD
ncbi:MAG: hypothetical protein RL689_2636 [Planctomycetota bacterium]|jgi:hypothetical protein